ncbi:electron transporter RnfB, partial [Thermodesulfobacteriota bacterium]
ADEEGVKFHFLAAPSRFIGDENGKLKQLEYIKMELGEPDASGRRRPVPIEGSETILEIDNVIAAIGQRPDISFIESGERLKDLEITRWDTIDADAKTGLTAIPYVLTGGDLFTGAATVVEAIGAGRLAARSIHRHLQGEEIEAPPNYLTERNPESVIPRIEGIAHKDRAKMAELEVEDRVGLVEVDLGIDEEQARAEADRCLNCGLTCYNREAKNQAA